MEIPAAGAILILLGCLFFVWKPDLLYWCAIFFVPFSSTAVVNVGSEGSFSGLQAWMFFGTLWLAHDLPRLLRTRGYWYRSAMRASIRKLILFFMVAVFSLVMPLWIDGRLWISSGSLDASDAQPLHLSLRHITQILYLAYGMLFAISLGVRNSDVTEFKKTVRISLISSVFVCLWGLLQWFFYLRNITYPAFIFNTNKNETAMGYEAVIRELGIARVASVATEPSGLAQYLLIALVFVLFALLGRQVLISGFWDRVALCLAVVVLFLSTSSTAFLGLAVLVPGLFVTAFVLGKLRFRHVFLIGSLLAGLGALYARSADLQSLADFAIFSKADSFSGLERINSVLTAMGYFMQYPILGVGWGTVTSHDLIFKLLADIGVIGLIVFALFLKSLWSGLWASAAAMRSRQASWVRSYWAICMLVATLVLLATNIFTGFSFVFGPFWLVLGLDLALVGCHKAQSTISLATPKQIPA